MSSRATERLVARVHAFVGGLGDAQGRDGDLAAAVDAMRAHRLLQACVPPEMGGEGLGLGPATAAATVDVLRTLGRLDLSIARIFEGHVNAAKLVHVHARGDARAWLLRALHEGALMAVWGAERGDPVRRRGDRLEGTKTFASGLAIVDLALVTARSEAGVELVAVDARDPARHGPAAWRVSAMEDSRSGTFDVTDLPAGPRQRVGDADDLFCEPHFRGGIWRYCAAQLGGIEALAEAMRRTLVERERHLHPHQSHRLGRALIAAESGRLWVHEAAARVERGEDVEAAVAYAILCRTQIEAIALELIATVERSLGTAAFFVDHPADRRRRDLAFYVRQADPDGMLSDAATTLVERGTAVGDLWQAPA